MGDGVLVVDKPAGWTSHDVVAKLRGVLNERRIGHSGTLDPSATGLLLVGVGRFTRFLRYLTELTKSYEFEIVFGIATSTLDADGEVVEKFKMTLTPDQVADAATTFLGEISQIPPMVSAVKVGGKRLHELAREGKVVERLPRLVNIYEFVTEPTEDPNVYKAKASCSSGTYVRVLGAELGQKLGGGAHIRNLRRTQIGSFAVSDAHELAAIENGGQSLSLTPLDAMRDYTVVVIGEADALAVRQGKRISIPADEERVAVSYDGDLVGVLVKSENRSSEGHEFKAETVTSY